MDTFCDGIVQNIERTECIGDSLPKINSNFTRLKNAGCDLETDVNALESEIARLLTLIQTLSTNMNNIGNYPYAELIHKQATNASGIYTTNGSNILKPNTPDNQYTDSYSINLNPQNIISINSGSFKFSSTGTYRIKLSHATPIPGYGVRGGVTWNLTKNGTSVAVGPSRDYSDSPDLPYEFETTIVVTSTSDLYTTTLKPGWVVQGGSSQSNNTGYACNFVGLKSSETVVARAEIWKVG